MVPAKNNSVLAQVMAWSLTGTKPLPEPMMTQFSDTCMREAKRSSSIKCRNPILYIYVCVASYFQPKVKISIRRSSRWR